MKAIFGRASSQHSTRMASSSEQWTLKEKLDTCITKSTLPKKHIWNYWNWTHKISSFNINSCTDLYIWLLFPWSAQSTDCTTLKLPWLLFPWSVQSKDCTILKFPLSAQSTDCTTFKFPWLLFPWSTQSTDCTTFKFPWLLFPRSAQRQSTVCAVLTATPLSVPLICPKNRLYSSDCCPIDLPKVVCTALTAVPLICPK